MEEWARCAEPNASISRPNVPKEGRNPTGRLGEDLVGDPLLVRPQTEDSQLVEPGRNRIALPVGQTLSRRQVNLIPAALLAHPRPDGPPEYLSRQVGDALGELALVGRVLNRVARQRAAIADQVAEQRQFVVAHAGDPGTTQIARHGDRLSLAQLIQALPTTNR